jgi:hypothetical protein
MLIGWDEAKQSERVSTREHLARGIRFAFDGGTLRR